MNSLIFNRIGSYPEWSQSSSPLPKKGEVLVDIQAAALNRRDLYIVQGKYSGIQLPCILGSDASGEYGSKPVLIYPALDWGNEAKFQGKRFRVLGMPDAGTFADQICVPRGNVFPMPAHLNWEQAAALPLAGLTAWRALFVRCQLKKGERVLITGIGGGVAVTALQLALAAGAEVWVSSGSNEKIERAIQLGAQGGVNYTAEAWDKHLKQLAGGFDVIIDSAAGDGFAQLPGLCNPGARIGLYGGTLGKVNGLSMQPIFWKQISVLGSTMGSPKDFKAMLTFVQKHEIIPVIDCVLPLAEGAKAFEKIEQGAQFGKIVLKV